FDLTVPGPASWLADGVVMHNSGAIEQDADLVMFIYRDEYYDPHSEKHGIAEIIIGKQRNGPTGSLEVQFHNAHVRFNDLARTGWRGPARRHRPCPAWIDRPVYATAPGVRHS